MALIANRSSLVIGRRMDDAVMTFLPTSVRTLRNDGTMICHKRNGMGETTNPVVTVKSWQAILKLWQHRVQCKDDEPHGEARKPGPAPGTSDGKVVWWTCGSLTNGRWTPVRCRHGRTWTPARATRNAADAKR